MLKRLSLFALLLTSTTGALNANFTPLVEGTGRVGDFLKGGGGQVWVPLTSTGSSVTFLQGGGGSFNDTSAANLGVGYRRAASSCWGWGVNGFFDYAYQSHESIYQGGVGAELFGPCWMARVNGYFPSHYSRTTGEVGQFIECTPTGGTNFDICELFRDELRQSYTGLDCEAGASICVPGGELWGFAGYYYFDASRVRAVQGPRLRLEYRLCQPAHKNVEVVLGGEWHHDHLHGNQGAFELRLLVPFGCKAHSSYATSCCRTICKRMARPVRRQPTAWVLDDLEKQGELRFTDLQVLFVEEMGMGIGTQEDPTNLIDAEMNSDPDDIVILMTTAGDIIATETTTLQLGQQWGSFAGQPEITVPLNGGGTVVIPNEFASGTATVVGNGFDIFELATDTRLFDIITQGGQNAVVGTGVSDVTLENLMINSPTQDGIQTTNSTNLTVLGTSVAGGAGCSLRLTNQNGGTFMMSSFADAQEGALCLIQPLGTLNFMTNTFDPAAGTTIGITGGTANLVFSGNTVNAVPGARLLDVAGGSNNATFMGGSFTTNGGEGVLVQNTTGGSINIQTAASIQNTTTTSLILMDNAGSFLMNGTIDGTAQAILIDGTSGNATLSGLTTTNMGATNPIEIIDTTAGTIQMGSVSLTDPMTNGYRLNNNAAAITFTTADMTSATLANGFNVQDQSGNLSVNGGTLTQTAGGVAVLIDQSSGSLNLGGLTVNNTGGTQPIQITNTTGGPNSLGGSIFLTNPVTTGFLLNNNDAPLTIGLANINSNTGATAFQITDQDGDLNLLIPFSSVTLSGGGKIVEIQGGTANIDMTQLEAFSTGATAPVDIQNTLGGTIQIGGAAAFNITDPLTQAFLLNNNGANLAFSMVGIFSNTTATAFEITNSLGNVTVGSNGTTQTGDARAVLIDNSSGVMDFTGHVFTNTGSTSNPAIEISGTPVGGSATFGTLNLNDGGTAINIINNPAGTFTFNGPTVIDNPATFGINIFANSASVSFDNATLTNATNPALIGLNIFDQAGTVTVTNSTFAQSGGGTGVVVEQASGTTNLAGLTVNNDGSTSQAISVTNTTAGTHTFGPVTITNANTGILVDNTSAGSVVFPSLVDIDTATLGIHVDNTSGGIVDFDDTMIANATTGASITNTTGGMVDIGSVVSITGGDVGINIQNNQAPGVLTFGDVTITNPALCAVDIGLTSANSSSITFNELNVDANATSPGALKIKDQTGAIAITNPSTFTQPNGGIAISVDASSVPIDLSMVTVDNDGATVAPIQVLNTTGGSVDFGTVGITGVNAPFSVDILTNVAPVAFADLNVAGTAGRVRASGGAGTFGVAAGTIDLSADTALEISSKAVAAGGVNLSNLVSTNPVGNGLNLAFATGGPITITALTITDAGSDAIRVFGGDPTVTIGDPAPAMPTANIVGGVANGIFMQSASPNFTYYGGLQAGGPAGAAARMTGMLGGSVTIDGTQGVSSNRFFAQTGGDGIQWNSAVGDTSSLNLSGCSSTSGLVGILIGVPANATGSIAITDCTIESPTNFVCIAFNGRKDRLDILRNTIQGIPAVSEGINVEGHVDNLDISWNSLSSNANCIGIDVRHTQPFTMVSVFDDNSLVGGVGQSYRINQSIMDAASIIDFTSIAGNSSDRLGVGVGFRFENSNIITVPGGTPGAVDVANPGITPAAVVVGNPLS